MSYAVGGVFCKRIHCSKLLDGIAGTLARWGQAKKEEGGSAARAA